MTASAVLHVTALLGGGVDFDFLRSDPDCQGADGPMNPRPLGNPDLPSMRWPRT